MKTPKPTRGSVGPGTLDQELQEHKGLHQSQNTNKGPPDSQGDQKARVAAAKGLLPPRESQDQGDSSQGATATQGTQEAQGM